MSTTIQQIAEQLNVSIATVSRALNGKPGVSDQTRQKVLAVANELQFMPNRAAQSLVGAQTYAVAFVIRRRLVGMGNPFYDRIMLGAESELENRGYHLVSITIDESRPDKKWLPPGLDTRRLDGLIVAGCELSHEAVTTLASLGLPTVLVANTVPGLLVDAISSDNQEGGRAATEHLVKHGHQHIVCLAGPKTWSPVRERIQGYETAMREHGLTPHVVYRDTLESEHSYGAMQEALRQYPETTAVFAVSDPVALGAMKALREMGKNVPNDVAIIGFDNIPWSETAVPSLTTAYIHKEHMGKLAARRLLELFEDNSQPPATIRVANELVLRRSCGCDYTSPYSALFSAQ